MLGLLDTASSVLGGGLGGLGGGTPESSYAAASSTQTFTSGSMGGRDSTWLYLAIGLAAVLLLSRKGKW